LEASGDIILSARSPMTHVTLPLIEKHPVTKQWQRISGYDLSIRGDQLSLNKVSMQDPIIPLGNGVHGIVFKGIFDGNTPCALRFEGLTGNIAHNGIDPTIPMNEETSWKDANEGLKKAEKYKYGPRLYTAFRLHGTLTGAVASTARLTKPIIVGTNAIELMKQTLWNYVHEAGGPLDGSDFAQYVQLFTRMKEAYKYRAPEFPKDLHANNTMYKLVGGKRVWLFTDIDEGYIEENKMTPYENAVKLFKTLGAAGLRAIVGPSQVYKALPADATSMQKEQKKKAAAVAAKAAKPASPKRAAAAAAPPPPAVANVEEDLRRVLQEANKWKASLRSALHDNADLAIAYGRIRNAIGNDAANRLYYEELSRLKEVTANALGVPVHSIRDDQGLAQLADYHVLKLFVLNNPALFPELMEPKKPAAKRRIETVVIPPPPAAAPQQQPEVYDVLDAFGAPPAAAPPPASAPKKKTSSPSKRAKRAASPKKASSPKKPLTPMSGVVRRVASPPAKRLTVNTRRGIKQH
jgi:hypothetical protein